MKLNAVAVYCGASSGNLPVYTESAKGLGGLLARRGIRLVYGGGGIGLMGAVADGALAAGGDVTGVIPDRLMEAELGHRGVHDMRVVASMHERKATMASLSDAFVILPGGFGTLDELFEAATWSILRYHQKPCGILNVGGYYDPLVAMMDRIVDSGFLPAAQREIVVVNEDPEALLDELAAWNAPPSRLDSFKGPRP
jgi:uncharacterized protein (TIGR00730 family)